MPTPIEAMADLIEKVRYCYAGAIKYNIFQQDAFRVACAVVDFHDKFVGREIVTTYSEPERRGRVAEVVDVNKFLCVFGTEKVELMADQFQWVTKVEAGDAGKPEPEPEPVPVPMILHCPSCGQRHIDNKRWETIVHTSHACQYCGMVWRPAVVPTVGVTFLPGFKNPD